MSHSHQNGAIPEEIAAFADAVLRRGVPLPRVVKTSGGMVEFKSARPVVKAELNFAKEGGPWPRRRWESIPAQLDPKAHRATVPVPAGTTAWYFNLFDGQGLVVSSECMPLPVLSANSGPGM